MPPTNKPAKKKAPAKKQEPKLKEVPIMFRGREYQQPNIALTSAVSELRRGGLTHDQAVNILTKTCNRIG